MHNNRPLFAIGALCSTPGALAALEQANVAGVILLMWHATGDWGEMDEDDRRANELAVAEGSRVFSSYTLATGAKVWVITEADRSSTTLLLPEEY